MILRCFELGRAFLRIVVGSKISLSRFFCFLVDEVSIGRRWINPIKLFEVGEGSILFVPFSIVNLYGRIPDFSIWKETREPGQFVACFDAQGNRLPFSAEEFHLQRRNLVAQHKE